MHRFKLTLCWLAFATPLFAQTTGSSVIDIHGFGGWAYGKTDGHKYSLGTEEGEYDNAEATRYVLFKNLLIHEIGSGGNHDCMKLSGLNHN